MTIKLLDAYEDGSVKVIDDEPPALIEFGKTTVPPEVASYQTTV
jgi:hypothetical protein